MSNLFDYLTWRGDLTFDKDPIGETDCLTFAWISYADLSSVVHADFKSKPVLLHTANTGINNKLDIKKIIKESLSFTKTSYLALDKCSECERFKNLKLRGFRNEIDYENETQFSAYTVEISPKDNVVVFRGTDDTIVGWKEDFNMAFIKEVPAQLKALEYLEEAAAATKGDLYVCGHSKGGNLAVFASCRASAKVRKRLKKVYSFDGPGFGDEEVLGEGRAEVLKKVESYVPEQSIVGMLLNHIDDYTVVKSSQRAINQHNAGNWQIIGKHFETCESVVGASIIFDEAIKNWINALPMDEREEFVDALFKILGANDAKTTMDINSDIMKSAAAMLTEYVHLSKKSRDMIKKITGALIKEGADLWIKKKNSRRSGNSD